MKIILLIALMISFSGCVTTSPELLEKADTYDKRSEAARKRAQAHGELEGTPENIEGIKRANRQAVYYKKTAVDAKYNFLWLDILASILKD
jgi:hypothetical protein